MIRALRALFGALGIAVVALIACLTPPVSGITRALLGLLSAVVIWFVSHWPQLEQRLAASEETQISALRLARPSDEEALEVATQSSRVGE